MRKFLFNNKHVLFDIATVLSRIQNIYVVYKIYIYVSQL